MVLTGVQSLDVGTSDAFICRQRSGQAACWSLHHFSKPDLAIGTRGWIRLRILTFRGVIDGAGIDGLRNGKLEQRGEKNSKDVEVLHA